MVRSYLAFDARCLLEAWLEQQERTARSGD